VREGGGCAYPYDGKQSLGQSMRIRPLGDGGGGGRRVKSGMESGVEAEGEAQGGWDAEPDGGGDRQKPAGEQGAVPRGRDTEDDGDTGLKQRRANYRARGRR
jgi:hypothetical protein